MPSSSVASQEISKKTVFVGVSVTAFVVWLLYDWRRRRNSAKQATLSDTEVSQKKVHNEEEMKRGGRVDYRAVAAAQRKVEGGGARGADDAPAAQQSTAVVAPPVALEAAGGSYPLKDTADGGPFQGGSWGEEVERVERERQRRACHFMPVNNEQSSNRAQTTTRLQQHQISPKATTMSTSEYASVDSPCASDLHSEGSQDSGRGCSSFGVGGGVRGEDGHSSSAASPGTQPSSNGGMGAAHDGAGAGGGAGMTGGEEPLIEVTPSYEFEIPQSLVGLVIGIKGKTIQELQTRSYCKMIIRRQHHLGRDNFQVCTVEGKREDINRCLQLLRRKFPLSRFPELNLKPLLPPPIPSPTAEMNHASQLCLPEGVHCEVALSSIQDPGHFFLQQPTHPTFPCLNRLDQYMMLIYSQPQGVIPDLPRPVESGVLCAAPALGGWYRAVTSSYFAESDEVLVKFVDYGGYSRLPSSDLKQIRSDFIWLHFQAVECYLAGVVPVEEEEGWSVEASQVFDELCGRSVIETLVVGTADDGTVLVELYTVNELGQQVRVSEELVERGFARWSFQQ